LLQEENEETNSASPSSSVSREPLPGHISSLRKPTSPAESAKEINSTLKDATQKHFDPRTGALQQGPSEMGQVAMAYSKSASPASNYSTTASTLNNADSLMTLGSRQDLLASNLTMYTSMETELNRLGEADPRLNQRTQSNNPLLTTFDVNTNPAAKNSIGVGTRGSSRSILKSSIATAAYPALGAFNHGQSHSLQQLNQHLQTSTGLTPSKSSFFRR